MRLREGDTVVSCDVAKPGAVMLFVSSSGHGKRTKLDVFHAQNRGGQGVRGMKVTASRGGVVAAFTVSPEDEILVFSSSGNIIRMDAKEISSQGRDATGVRVARVARARPWWPSLPCSRANPERTLSNPDDGADPRSSSRPRDNAGDRPSRAAKPRGSTASVNAPRAAETVSSSGSTRTPPPRSRRGAPYRASPYRRCRRAAVAGAASRRGAEAGTGLDEVFDWDDDGRRRARVPVRAPPRSPRLRRWQSRRNRSTMTTMRSSTRDPQGPRSRRRRASRSGGSVRRCSASTCGRSRRWRCASTSARWPWSSSR